MWLSGCVAEWLRGDARREEGAGCEALGVKLWLRGCAVHLAGRESAEAQAVLVRGGEGEEQLPPPQPRHVPVEE